MAPLGLPLLLLGLGLSALPEAWSLRRSGTPVSPSAVAAHGEAGLRPLGRRARRGLDADFTSVGRRDWPVGFPRPGPGEYRVAILLVGQSLLNEVPRTTTTTTTTTTTKFVAAAHVAEASTTVIWDVMGGDDEEDGSDDEEDADEIFAQRRKKHDKKGKGKGRRRRGVSGLRRRRSWTSKLPWWIPPDFAADSKIWDYRMVDDKNTSYLKMSWFDLNQWSHIDYWPWASFLHYVYEPLNVSLGRAPDVFLCTKNVTGRIPREVKDSFNISADNQFERQHLCYNEVVGNNQTYGHYDWFIKVRPDFVFTRQFPNMFRMHPMRLHSRFREAQGITDLTSAHFAWEACTEECNGIPPKKYGYTNDDMVFTVSSVLADKVFVGESEAWALRSRFSWPRTWISPIEDNWETLWSKGLAAGGVLSEPLPVGGYPRNAKTNHEAKQAACLFEVIPKTRCGRALPLGQAHRDLQRAVAEMQAEMQEPAAPLEQQPLTSGTIQADKQPAISPRLRRRMKRLRRRRARRRLKAVTMAEKMVETTERNVQ